MNFLSTILRTLKGQNSLTVLSLHRISPDIDFFWQPIHPNTFDRLLNYVKKNYEVICFRDLNSLPKNNAKPFLILSFDDGYYDFIEYALPLLKKYNLPSNHNLVVSCLETNQLIWTQRLNYLFNFLRDNKLEKPLQFNNQFYKINKENWAGLYISLYNKLLHTDTESREGFLIRNEKKNDLNPSYRMINWREAGSLASEGIEIGCHTFNHVSFNETTRYDEVFTETVKAQQILKEKLGCNIDILSLPNGQSCSYLEQVEFSFQHILKVKDEVNPLAKGKYINRINVVQESLFRLFLRIELIHKYVKK